MVGQEIVLYDETMLRLLRYAKKRFPDGPSTLDDVIRSLLKEVGF